MASIKDAEKIAKRDDLQAVIILEIARDGTITGHSYGETRKKCRVIGSWMDGLLRNVLSIVPFQTVFGWGNGGVPKPVQGIDPEWGGR